MDDLGDLRGSFIIILIQLLKIQIGMPFQKEIWQFLLIALNIPITLDDAQPLLYSNRLNSHCGLNLHYLYRTHCVWCPQESCLWGPTINMLNLQQPDLRK